MDAKTDSIYRILKAALLLFREKGFAAASVREIAAAAGVSLGMVNHYFENKEFLGTQCLLALSDYVMENIPADLLPEKDPILYDLVTIRAFTRYVTENGYREYYLDSLRQDFFFKYICDQPTRMTDLLGQFYPVSCTQDEAQLYCRYMPYMMEKTLVLKKAEGLFPGIPESHIPYMISETAMSHFIPKRDVAARDLESIRISSELTDALEPTIPDERLRAFAERYAARLQAANSSRRSAWIQQMSAN